MNTEDMLIDLFTHEADRRPDAAAVLDAVQQRIARQDHTRATRAASALGAAAAVAAIAGAVTVATAPSEHRTAPPGTAPAGGGLASTPASTAPPVLSAPASAGPSSVATPRPTAPTRTSPTHASPTSTATTPLLSNSPSAPSVTAPHRVEPTGTRPFSTINAGWLPGPAKQNSIGTVNQPGFEERDWDVTVDGVAMDVLIWTETGSLPSRMQATGGSSDFRALRINGHPGREFTSANITIIAFDLGNGTTAYVGPSVEHRTAAVTSERITAIAVKVARNMQFNRHDPIVRR